MNKIKVEFNPDTMSIRDLKEVNDAFRTILVKVDNLSNERKDYGNINQEIGAMVRRIAQEFEI